VKVFGSSRSGIRSITGRASLLAKAVSRLRMKDAECGERQVAFFSFFARIDDPYYETILPNIDARG